MRRDPFKPSTWEVVGKSADGRDVLICPLTDERGVFNDENFFVAVAQHEEVALDARVYEVTLEQYILRIAVVSVAACSFDQAAAAAKRRAQDDTVLWEAGDGVQDAVVVSITAINEREGGAR